MAHDNGSLDDILRAFKQAAMDRDRHALDRQIDLLLRIDAPLGAQWRAMARVSLTNGRIDTARVALDRYGAHASGAADQFERAVLLAECGDIAAAIRSLQSVPAGYPDPATRAHLQGTLAMQSGDLEQACECFERALMARPTSGVTWLSYAQLMRRDRPAQWAERLVDYHRSGPRIPGGDHGPFLYALAEAYHAVGEFDAAFATYVAGGRMVRARRGIAAPIQPADPDDRYWPDAGSIHSVSGDTAPIFVLGLPRSGTTLVEQILASHSKVAGGGEMTALHLAIDGASRGAVNLGNARDGRRALEIFAQDYLQLARARFPRPGSVVDKTLNVTRHIGWMAAAFPDAPLIYVRRDVVDTALSCLKTYFSQGIDWSFDLDDIVAHFEFERDLLRRWQDRLGDRLIVMKYRDLVERPETTIRALLDDCDLPFEQTVMHPEATVRPVLTASAVQVRSPINQSGLGIAAPYRTHMAPYLDRLLPLDCD